MSTCIFCGKDLRRGGDFVRNTDGVFPAWTALALYPHEASVLKAIYQAQPISQIR